LETRRGERETRGVIGNKKGSGRGQGALMKRIACASFPFLFLVLSTTITDGKE